MTRLGKLLRNFRRKLTQKYILPNLETPSKLNEAPTNYKAIIKADDWVNFVNYTQSDEFKVLISNFLFKFKHLLFPYIYISSIVYQHYYYYIISKRLVILCCKVKSAATKLARSKSLYQHRMGRGGYARVIDQMVT